MTKFELTYTDRIYAAKTETECNNVLNNACERCVQTGRHCNDCKGCMINAAYEVMTSNFMLADLDREIEEKLIQTKKRLGLV